MQERRLREDGTARKKVGSPRSHPCRVGSRRSQKCNRVQATLTSGQTHTTAVVRGRQGKKLGEGEEKKGKSGRRQIHDFVAGGFQLL